MLVLNFTHTQNEKNKNPTRRHCASLQLKSGQEDHGQNDALGVEGGHGWWVWVGFGVGVLDFGFILCVMTC